MCLLVRKRCVQFMKAICEVAQQHSAGQRERCFTFVSMVRGMQFFVFVSFLLQDTLQPMPSGPFGESSPSEWYPPGHGDVYYSLYASGLLENLINQVGTWRFIEVTRYLTLGLFCFNPALGRKGWPVVTSSGPGT